jgi:pimeloyl-ACP methyl ester carboxylesterase
MMSILKTWPLILVFTIFSSCYTPFKNYPQISTFDELPYPFEVQKVDLKDNISLAYADVGSGPNTIIFIHGLGSYLPAWRKNVEVLSTQYRCIAIDLPGYGKSSKGPYDGSMQFFADVVAEFMDKLHLESVIVAGHSMGGQIAITMALKHPKKVRALVLAAPAGFETFNEGQKQWFREVMTAKGVALTTPEQVQSNLGYNFYRMPKDAHFMITDRLAMRHAKDFDGYCYIIPKSVQGMVNEPVFDLLPNIKQPVLVVYGEQDNLIPNRFLNAGRTRKIAEAGHAQLPHSRLVMVPKAGHFVQWEGADTFNQSVQEFVNSGFQVHR